jgi:hypothetical protein
MRFHLVSTLISFLVALLIVGLALCPEALPAGSGVLTFETGRQPAFEIHVAVDGHDDTGDGSAAKPYASIERAAQDAVRGAAIRIHAGTYAGGTYLEDLVGTASAPIWIGGAPGEARPVIKGGGEGIHLVRVHYVVVHDLEVRDTAYNGINTDDGGDYANADATRHVVIRDLSIHHIGGGGNQDCLKLSGVNDYFVLNSAFAFCGGGGSGSGIDQVGCHHGLIVGNLFHDLSANAMQNKGGSQDIEIRANHMLDAGDRAVNIGGSTGYEYFRPPLSATEPNFEARDIRVIANVIEGSETPFAFVGAVDSLATNNTIIDPENWLLRILQETVSDATYVFLPSGNNTVTNNLFYFDHSKLSTYVNIGPNTAPATFAFSNNLWYAHDDPAQSQPTLPVAETNGVLGKDPLFQSPTVGDYHLQGDSPAIGQGVPLAGVVDDYDGWTYNVPPSIGAFEGNRPGFPHYLYLPLVKKG